MLKIPKLTIEEDNILGDQDYLNTMIDYSVVSNKDYKVVDEATWTYWLNKYEGIEIKRPLKHASDYGYEIDTLFQV